MLWMATTYISTVACYSNIRTVAIPDDLVSIYTADDRQVHMHQYVAMHAMHG
jgi:hypothetical protein